MPKGRSSSAVRTGLFIRAHLLNAGEDHPSAIHRALREKIAILDESRPKAQRLRAPVFSSFYRYLKHLEYFGLIERSGQESPLELTSAPLLLVEGEGEEARKGVLRYYRLTAKGREEPPHPAFGNPIGVWKAQGFSYG